jgi:hypothetical protein
MKAHALVVCFALVCFLPAKAVAANGITNDPGYPKSDVEGKIIGQGDYTLDAGWEIESMTTYVAQADGQGLQMSCDFDKGSWFPGPITRLPSGKKYSVVTVMTVRKEGMTRTYYTPTVQVTVK